MFSKALMHIWDRKLEIAKIEKEVKLKQLAHEQAHNFAMSISDNRKLIAGDCPQYQENYDRKFQQMCKCLMPNSPK